MPKNFWGEALLAAVHVINLSPAVALNTEVPDKIWFGKNLAMIICVSLVAGHLFMFLRMKDPS